MTTDRIKQIEERIERIITENKCEDREIQEALLAVAKSHIWRQGFVARLRFWANIFGALGTLGGVAFFVSYLIGWEFVRR